METFATMDQESVEIKLLMKYLAKHACEGAKVDGEIFDMFAAVLGKVGGGEKLISILRKKLSACVSE